jgi:hypothetical protein
MLTGDHRGRFISYSKERGDLAILNWAGLDLLPKVRAGLFKTLPYGIFQ